ncbi:hypothetical protein [Piscinibacter sp.]|uniref:hypothetical protein n=1 Tax=Piscinibacter sp. TaxID=1903157 RepID=UPI0039E37A32
MSSTYRTELADLREHDRELQGLWARNLDGCDTAAAAWKLAHGYLGNPAGQGLTVLLFDGDCGAALGAQGLHERRLHLGRKVLRAACMADFVVDVAHRSLGPALMLMKRATEQAGQGFDLVYGLPNRKAAAVCARAGLVKVAQVHRYVKLLQTRERFASRLPSPAASAASVLADGLLTLADQGRRWGQAWRWAGVELAWGDGRAAAFVDAVWARRRAGLLLSERSSALLAWRFDGGRRGGWRLCGVADAAGTPVGWAVWRPEGNDAEIGDFFVADPMNDAAASLTVVAAELRRQGLAGISMEMLAPPAVEAALLAAGMSRRDDAMPVFARVAPSGVLPQAGHWYLTRFDNDSD